MASERQDESSPEAGVPFALAGRVRSWDPITRLLCVEGQRLVIPPGIDIPALIVGECVTISGQQGPSRPCAVTAIRVEPH